MRLALVVQRYGKDVLGGAETHAALMAGLLARHHAVEVLTTTAHEYQTWRNHYAPGLTEVDGVPVRRFPVTQGRLPSWHAVHRVLLDGLDSSRFSSLDPAVRAAFAARVRGWPDALQEEFIRGQGPVAPELTEHLRRTPFDRVLFVTYLYPTSYDGLAVVPAGRARIVPTLHDEPPAYLPVFGRRLRRAVLLCSTEAEIALVSRLYPCDPPPARLLGYGIALPGLEEARPTTTMAHDPYLLFAGRVDAHKGVPELLAWYRALRETVAAPPRLVLIGELSMPLGRERGVEARGVVSDDEKTALMRDALALVHPSPFESLGIVLLEAMACGTPIIVNADADVMVEHCRRGGGGVWVRDAAEFIAAVSRLGRDPELRHRLGRSGRTYVEREYSLTAYEARLLEEFPTESARRETA
jgi:glycosyltransferase involved in cell wall biosynthesis